MINDLRKVSQMARLCGVSEKKRPFYFFFPTVKYLEISQVFVFKKKKKWNKMKDGSLS